MPNPDSDGREAKQRRAGLARSLREKTPEERGLVRSPSQEKVNAGLFVPGGGVGYSGLRAAGRIPGLAPWGQRAPLAVPRVVERVVERGLQNPSVTRAYNAVWRTVQNPYAQTYAAPFIRAGIERSVDPLIPGGDPNRVRSMLGLEDTSRWVRRRLGLEN